MTISSKEALESADPIAKSAAPSSAAPPKSDNARLRADAVSLDVPVKVHGSRVTDVSVGTTAQTEPFEEETSTMIVFPHGGVLRMATNVNVGQMLVITNQKTRQDAICRVVKVRAYSSSQAYVEVEFTHRQFGYWGVHFSSEDEDLSGPTAVAAKPEPLPPLLEARRPDPPVVSSVSVKVEDLPKPFLPQPRPGSAFVSLGSKEDFEVAATTPPAGSAPPVSARESIAAPAPVIPPPVTPAPVSRPAVSPVSVSEELVEAPRSSSRAFGALTGELSTPAFSDMGTRLGRGISDSAPSASSSGKGLLIGVAAAVVLAVAATGTWYFRQQPSAQQSSSRAVAAELPANTSAAPSSVAETQNLAPVTSSAPASSAGDSYGQIAAASSSTATRSARQPESSSAGGPHVLGEEVSSPAPAASQQKAMGNIGVAVLGAHPLANKKSSGNVAAPEIPTLPSSVALPNIAASAPSLAPPPVPAQRIRIGGAFVPAKLLHSSPPVYPASARASGLEGDVVVSAQLDKAGNVTGVQVLSGLAVLRQAAAEAVRAWKYQPATLDGDAVASQVNVTVQFRK